MQGGWVLTQRDCSTFPYKHPTSWLLRLACHKACASKLLAGLLGPGMLLPELIAVRTVHLWATGSCLGTWLFSYSGLCFPCWNVDQIHSHGRMMRDSGRRESLQFSFQRCNKNKMSSAKAVQTWLEPRNDSNSPGLGHSWGWRVHQECLWSPQDMGVGNY